MPHAVTRRGFIQCAHLIQIRDLRLWRRTQFPAPDLGAHLAIERAAIEQFAPVEIKISGLNAAHRRQQRESGHIGVAPCGGELHFGVDQFLLRIENIENCPAADAVFRLHTLKGLVFVAGTAAFRAEGVAADGVQVGGLAPLDDPDFKRKMNDLIGKPITFGQLHEITEAVLAAYKSRGAPLVRAVVPQQSIDQGTIQVVVTEFRAGKISAEGNHWFSSDQILAPFHISYGDPILPEKMSRALDDANANPFRSVELVYRPSVDPGHTDIVAMTRDRFPFRPYASFDNSNARVLGRDRYSVGFNWGRAFGADAILSYQFSTSSDLFDGHRRSDGTQAVSFMSHSAYWSTQLPWQDRLIVFGAYERVRPDLGTGLDLLGTSGQASMRYQHRLADRAGFKQTLQVGFDFKTTNNNLDFGGTNVSANRTDVDQFLIEYSASRADSMGVWSLDASVVASPGGLTTNNHDTAFQPTLTHSGRFAAKSR